jgi:hypothetical protein
MNSLWDIRIFLGLVPKESPCTIAVKGQVQRFVRQEQVALALITVFLIV